MRNDLILKIYKKELKKSLLLSSKEEIVLSEKILKGDKKALNKLVEANLRFVVTVAKRYEHQGIDLDDLVSIGNMGLITAAKRFDGSKKYRFISYAVWWIRQQILLALAEQSRSIRIPLSTIIRLFKIRKVRDSLFKKTGGKIDSDTLSKATGYPVEDVDLLLNLEEKPLLLNASSVDDGADTIENFSVEEESTDDIEENAKIIDNAMKCLSEKEMYVLRAYYGFDNDMLYTLDDIGKKYKVSKERIRQIKISALKRMKKMLTMKKLDEK